MPEAGHQEALRRLVPARIEMEKARIAMEFEIARSAGRRHEAQIRRDPQAIAVDARMDRELRDLRLDRIFQQHVEQLLIPVELEIVGHSRPEQVRARRLVGGKRAV